MAILYWVIFLLKPRKKNKFVRSYIFRNTFNILLYRRKTVQTNQVIDPDNYLAWNQDIAEAMIKYTSLLLYFYYSVVSRMPFWFFAKILERKKGEL